MKRPFIAVSAVVVAIGLAGCSSGVSTLGNRDARVSINGKATNALQPVTCIQTGQSWMMRTADKDPGFTATIQLGNEVTAQAVDIHNLGNFTGTYWEGNLGKAKASVSEGRFNISGEAEGAFADKPNQRVKATFDISAEC